MIKVLIVDDSAFMRVLLTNILEEDDSIEVIGTAQNGNEALEMIERLNPDVITLDIEMPVMDGISALKIIVDEYNKPVLMLSNSTKKGADLTIKALEIGAVGFLEKPKNIFNINSEYEKRKILNKVKMASKTDIRKSNYKLNKQKFSSGKSDKIESNGKFTNIIAIGTSTGGPRALQEIIPKLPNDIDGSILVVQHMPPGFTNSLAIRLNSLSQVKVKEAENGEKMIRGCCYIAPGDFHMIVDEQVNGDLIIKLLKTEPISGHRPSVDMMMKSVAKIKKYNKIGIILTGMGSDGAEGITLISKNNGYTVAQDESTCTVFGMPKTAINYGKIDKILPLYNIAEEIYNKTGGVK